MTFQGTQCRESLGHPACIAFSPAILPECPVCVATWKPPAHVHLSFSCHQGAPSTGHPRTCKQAHALIPPASPGCPLNTVPQDTPICTHLSFPSTLLFVQKAQGLPWTMPIQQSSQGTLRAKKEHWDHHNPFISGHDTGAIQELSALGPPPPTPSYSSSQPKSLDTHTLHRGQPKQRPFIQV